MPRKTTLGPAGVPGRPYTFAAKTAAAVAVARNEPDWTTTQAAIVRELAQVSAVGRIHGGMRHLRDEIRVSELFGVWGERESAGARVPLRGWMVSREDIDEQHWSSQRTLTRETWRLQALQSADDESGSERSFQDLIGRVLERFRSVTTLGNHFAIDTGRVPTIGYVQLGGRLCHFAQLDIRAEGANTINALTVSAPRSLMSTADARDTYGSVAAQLAGYVTDLELAGRVHPARAYSTTREDALDLFTVAEEGLLESKRVVRSWQVFRAQDTEARGLGNRVAVATPWALQAAWSWRDAVHSYEDFQTHIDDARIRFRSLGQAGSLRNITQTIAAPLRVREIGARMLRGVLTHFADCIMPIEEVVHA